MKILDKICRIITIIVFCLLLFLIVVVVADKIYKNKTSNMTDEILKSTSTYEIKSEMSYYSVTSEERLLLAKLAHSEASICSQECQRDIISVVFNRLESGKWRKDINSDGKITIYDIIYYPNAFTPATTGAIDKWEPTQKEFDAVDYVLKNGPTVPPEVRYFRTDYDFKWEGYSNYKIIDNVYFGYFEKWRNGIW